MASAERDEAFVEQAYRLILGREADADGMAACLDQLRRGARREAVTLALLGSPEAAAGSRKFTGVPESPGGSGLIGRLRRRIKDQALAFAKRVLLDRMEALEVRLAHLSTDNRERFQGLEARLAAIEAKIDDLANRPRAIPVDGAILVELDGLFFATPAEAWQLAGHLAFHGTLEPGLVRRVVGLLEPGMVFVDVGANVGLFTVRAARAVGGCGRVYAYEPAPRTASMLERNVAMNGQPGQGVVKVRRAAVSDKPGQVEFTVYPAEIGHSTLFAKEARGEAIMVPAVTLDAELAGEPIVDLVKIDAEGAEPLVMDGMRELVARNPRMRIFLEFAPGHLKRAGVQPSEFLASLRERFAVERVDDITGTVETATDAALLAADSVNLELVRR